MDENLCQPIGGPKPVDPRRGRKWLERIVAGIVIGIGGAITFASFLQPTRARGASRSAKLLWQERQEEIREIIQRETAGPLNGESAEHPILVAAPQKSMAPSK